MIYLCAGCVALGALLLLAHVVAQRSAGEARGGEDMSLPPKKRSVPPAPPLAPAPAPAFPAKKAPPSPAGPAPAVPPPLRAAPSPPDPQFTASQTTRIDALVAAVRKEFDALLKAEMHRRAEEDDGDGDETPVPPRRPRRPG